MISRHNSKEIFLLKICMDRWVQKKPFTLYTLHSLFCSSVGDRSLIIPATDGSGILHTLLVKHYNDLFDKLSSERGKDEVTYFYVGD